MSAPLPRDLTNHEIRAAAVVDHHEVGLREIDTFNTVVRRPEGAFVQCWQYITYDRVRELKELGALEGVRDGRPDFLHEAGRDEGASRSQLPAGEGRSDDSPVANRG